MQNCVNVAFGKPARQSSLSKWSSSSAAMGVLSGELIADFGFHTSLENHPWWTVDLLWNYPIEAIIVHNRIKKAGERARSLKVEVSCDGNNWELVHRGIAYFGAGAVALRLPLGGRLLARYVRLSLEEKSYFHLSKVEVLVDRTKLQGAEGLPGSLSFPVRPSVAGERPRVRAAILGTSNSIMKNGYLIGLANNDVEVVRNASLGSSHAVMVPFRLPLLEDVDFDVLILDVVVNEQKAYLAKLYNLELSLEIFVFLLAWCFRKRVSLVVLLMPNKSAFRSEELLNAHAMRSHYRKICGRFGVPVFDGFEFVERLAGFWNRSAVSFFKDSHHLNGFCAQVLGRALGCYLHTQLAPFSILQDREVQSSDFRFVSAIQATHSIEIVERKTSIASVNFLRLVPGEKIAISFPDRCEVVGVVLNMSQTNASILLEGATTLRKRLDSLYFEPGRPLWLVCWSLVTAVEVEKELLLQCFPSDLTVDSEKNDHSSHRKVDYVGQSPVVEIAGIIVRNPLESRRVGFSPEVKGELGKPFFESFVNSLSAEGA